MEPRFGHDFSRVRVHADSEAAASARALNATAYTVGRDVVFDEGKYQPHTQQGRELLAHELTHTIQQNQATGASGPLTLGATSDASEREAGHAASVFAGQGSVAVNSRRSVGVQRQVNPSPPPHLDLAESASPMMARAIGSVTIDGFETGKSDISKTNQAELASAAGRIQTLLNKYPASKVRVIGHTDAVGKENDNQTLGQARADSVQAALAGLGIPAEAIQTESKGETQLLVKSQKAEPRNRRVEVRFEPDAHRFTHFIPDVSLSPPGSPAPSGGIGGKPDMKLPPDYKIPAAIPPYAPKDPEGSLPSWMWKPLPAGPARPGVSLEGSIDSVAKKITSFLPKSIQGKAQDLVKSAIEKGITSGLDAGLQAAGVDQTGRQAIEKAAEAAIKQKFGGSQ
jgi:outer membrane protein OmpA-like peptidoglycan-associated protein